MRLESAKKDAKIKELEKQNADKEKEIKKKKEDGDLGDKIKESFKKLMK